MLVTSNLCCLGWLVTSNLFCLGWHLDLQRDQLLPISLSHSVPSLTDLAILSKRMHSDLVAGRTFPPPERQALAATMDPAKLRSNIHFYEKVRVTCPVSVGSWGSFKEGLANRDQKEAENRSKLQTKLKHCKHGPPLHHKLRSPQVLAFPLTNCFKMLSSIATLNL